METKPQQFTLSGFKAILVSVAAAIALILAVLQAVIGTLPGQVESLGATNFTNIGIADGAVTEPSLQFYNDTDTGMYRVGANDIGVAVGGSKVGDFTSSGWTGGVSIGSNDLSGRNITATGTASVAGAAALNGGITADTSAFSVADTTGNTVISGTLNVTSTLSLAGVSFTGPIKYGTASSYTSGAAITHSFATTPTACLLFPVRDVTSTLTLGATTFSSDMATAAEPIYWFCGK